MIKTMKIRIGNKDVGFNCPVYFIADIAANHDGDLSRAKDLIHMAAEAGADAAKFQHFKADTIVSDYGFKSLDIQKSHQENWEKSVFEVYQDVSLDPEWTPVLKETCEKAGMEFMTSPYSIELVNKLDPYLKAYKVGSGDITYFEILEQIAKKMKPVILGTGASLLEEIKKAVKVITKYNRELILMQCNTNYTASTENFKHVNLSALKTFAEVFPGTVLGLSDHTPGHSAVLGAVALGAKVVEKHFTDDRNKTGPDHKFSMMPADWKEMVERCRELEDAIGDGVKRIEDNEKETVVIQRRALRAKFDLSVGSVLHKDNLVALRPCPHDGLPPYMIDKILGKSLLREIKAGEHILLSYLK